MSWIHSTPGRRSRGLPALLLAAILALSLGLAACGGDDDGDETTPAADESEGAILLVPHGVEDFDRWKPVFEEHREVRAEYGGSRDLVYQDLDDPNQTTVYMTYPSAEDAEDFFADPSLAEAMERAGVVPPIPPDRELLREVEVVDYENPGSGAAGDEENGVILVIRHDVDDFEPWKPVFDEVEELRREHGATGHRLFAALDDPNDVIVYESYPSRKQALAFFNDERLADAMERAGVVEDTVVQTLRTLDLNEEY